jgi:hypothetical protein
MACAAAAHYSNTNLAGKERGGKRREPHGRAHPRPCPCLPMELAARLPREREVAVAVAVAARHMRRPAGVHRSLAVLAGCWVGEGAGAMRRQFLRRGWDGWPVRRATRVGVDGPDGSRMGGARLVDGTASPLKSGWCGAPGRRRGSSALYYLAWSMSHSHDRVAASW